MKILNILFVLSFMLLWCSGFVGDALAGDVGQIPVNGKITLVDVTSDGCKPCEDMRPIIDSLKQEYHQKIEIVTVDFWKNPQVVKKIGTNTSPTFVIFNTSGEEVFRHYGYIPEKELVSHLESVIRR